MNELYLTAQELGITEQEREALIKTIGVLEEEQIIFDMSTPCNRLKSREHIRYGAVSACGTHACIGGTMSLLIQNNMTIPEKITPGMQGLAIDYVDKHSAYDAEGVFVSEERTPLTRLFFDETEEDVRPEEGIAAIKRFLHGNKRPWGETALGDWD